LHKYWKTLSETLTGDESLRDNLMFIYKVDDEVSVKDVGMRNRDKYFAIGGPVLEKTVVTIRFREPDPKLDETGDEPIKMVFEEVETLRLGRIPSAAEPVLQPALTPVHANQTSIAVGVFDL
jgi:hypothetical protein